MFRTRTGELVPFIKENLYVSIYESCRHRARAVEDAIALTDTVLSRIRHKDTDVAVIPVDALTDAAPRVLLAFDPSASTYYKAYYCKK